jgi:hypothetical protein
MTSDWKQDSIDRRDFRHVHGDPEVPKWRKKSKKVNRAHCEHTFTEWEERFSWGWKSPEVVEFEDRTEYTSVGWGYKNRRCTKCNKREFASYARTLFQIRDRKGILIKEQLTETPSRW